MGVHSEDSPEQHSTCTSWHFALSWRWPPPPPLRTPPRWSLPRRPSTLPLQPPRLGSTLPSGPTPSTLSTTMSRLLRSAPLTSMTSRMSPLPRLPSRLLSMTPLPVVLLPSRLPLPSTRSLPLPLSLLLPSLPLLPSPTPVCTTLPTPMPSTTSATPATTASLATTATLAPLTTLESSATPTLDFLLLPLLLPLLRHKLSLSSISPSNSSRAFVHQNSFDCQSEP